MKSRSLALLLCLLSCSAPLLLSVRNAQGRVEERLSYTKTQSYRSALRYLRVDHRYEVIEKDPDSGYLLFEYPVRDTQVIQGSIEVVERSDSIALVVQLPQMPSYHERLLIEGLLKKLRADYGAPPSKARPEEPAKDPDEGRDHSDEPGTSKPGKERAQESPSPPSRPRS